MLEGQLGLFQIKKISEPMNILVYFFSLVIKPTIRYDSTFEDVVRFPKVLHAL